MTENEWARTGHVPPSSAPSATLAPPPPAPPWGGSPLPDPPRRRSLASVAIAASLAGFLGAAAGFGGAYAVLGGNEITLTGSGAPPSAVTAAPGSVAAAAQIATPSTVDIKVRVAQGNAEGSGVVLTADGVVLTNNHVVAGASDIAVTLADGSEHTATVVGTSPSYDLAVIRIAGVSGLTPATLGSSANLQVGQQVVAIGSPQGLSGTVTTGIVSSIDRTVGVQGDDGSTVVYNGLQTDTAINPGNSGGPLVDLDGRVIGINSAIATSGENGGNIGLGFAIPVDTAHRVAQEILADGTASKPVLGVQGSADAGQDGAVIRTVEPGSGAAAAGLTAGDVVTRVGGAEVEDFADLVARIGAQTPGTTVQLTVQGSDGAERTVSVTLGSTPDRAPSTAEQERTSSPFGQGGPFGR